VGTIESAFKEMASLTAVAATLDARPE
jgi:hypothetical protein